MEVTYGIENYWTSRLELRASGVHGGPGERGPV